MYTPEIKEKLERLDPKFLEDISAFLDYLLYLQSKGQSPYVDLVSDEKLQLARKFRGDALFPNIRTSKYDVYEQ